MSDYDIACRRMVKSDARAFLRWLFKQFDKVARHRGWVDTRRLPFPDKPDQTGDLVFEIEALLKAQPLWALALEFQIEPDPEMFGRMMVYLGTLWRERRPDRNPGDRYQLASCVINLTGSSKSHPVSASFVWPGPDRVEVILNVREVFLAEESAQEVLDGVASGLYDRALLPWVPLMLGGSDEAVIKRWADLAGQEPDGRRKAGFGYHALVFAEKCADPGAWRKALEGWGMIRSETMEKTRGEERAETLVETLALVTGQEVPEELSTKIRACTDRSQLRAWLAVAVKAESLEQFRTEAGL